MKEPKKILLAFSGGLDSTVAGFLLKNQGYEVIAICFQFLNVQDKESLGQDFESSCHVEKLEETKEIAEKLGLPFYAVNAKSQFESEILDLAISNRLFGKSLSTCTLCNQLKIQILFEKAHKLRCDAIATGHYAKIHKSADHSKINIYSSNDKENDQSRFLAGVEDQYLKKLMLPLSDLRKVEVQEIANRYQLKYSTKPLRTNNCFVQTSDFSKYLSSRVNSDLTPTASFYNAKIGSHAGENEGISHYYLGQNKIKSDSKIHSIDKKLSVIKLDIDSREIILGDEKRLYKSSAKLTKMNFTEGFDRSKPISVIVPLRVKGKEILTYINAEVQFKNNDTALLLFEEKVFNVLPGSRLSLFAKSGKNSKLLGSGEVLEFDDYHLYDKTSFLAKKEEAEQEKDVDQDLDNPNIINLDLDDEGLPPSEESNDFKF